MGEEKETILVVDDDVVVIDILVSMLKDDYNLGIAKDGKAALKYVDKVKPKVVLLDIGLPEMSGYDVCYRIKSSSETSDIAVIFISGQKDGLDSFVLSTMGADDFISKPFDKVEILQKISKYIYS